MKNFAYLLLITTLAIATGCSNQNEFGAEVIQSLDKSQAAHVKCMNAIKSEKYIQFRKEFSLEVLYRDCMTRQGYVVE
tara:strand:- start:84 stop:317 length:234 start_codon:yes stop_codon:yes gene_type:complete